MRQVVIIGSGCAGYTAAIYAARANLRPLVVQGLEAGGQLSLTTDVENFPGFPDGIEGPELIDRMRLQAERFGAEVIRGEVEGVDLSRRPFRLTVNGADHYARALIVASGARARWLGLSREMELVGHGISSCATCDGPFFRGQEIGVVGGGDSAMEEALYLTRHAARVYVIHRRDRLRASRIMQDRALANPNIEFVWNAEVVELLGARELEGVVVRDTVTGELTTMQLKGLFVAIGHIPNTTVFRGQLDMDADGYLIVRGGSETNVEGVFAAGDVHDRRYRQAVTAAGSGCKAAMDAERFLEEVGDGTFVALGSPTAEPAQPDEARARG